MAKGAEARLVRDPTIRAAKQMGVKSIRMYFGPGVQTGWPDDLFLIPGGRPLFIEFKAPGEEVTPGSNQERKINDLIGLGYDVEVCDNKDEAISAISQRVGTSRVPKTRQGISSTKSRWSPLFGPRPR